MTRLERELQRLYLPDAAAPGLVDAAGQVKAGVLGLARPADWATLGSVWQGVQAELELPAPSIVVAGEAGYQLWFSFDAPVPAARVMVFLEALRRHYLGEVDPRRVTLWPAPDGAVPGQARHAPAVPAVLADGEHWSAFVAPDLAPVFGDEPWLDLPPNLEGQASLLARLASMPSADLQQILDRLAPAATEVAPPPASASADTPVLPATDPGPRSDLDPAAFLREVMNDPAVPLALRIDAAKALLPLASGGHLP